MEATICTDNPKMADDPSDTGLVCGHDTSIFDVARDKFTKSAVHESLVQEL